VNSIFSVKWSTLDAEFHHLLSGIIRRELHHIDIDRMACRSEFFSIGAGRGARRSSGSRPTNMSRYPRGVVTLLARQARRTIKPV
jgi:hypothetical protein